MPGITVLGKLYKVDEEGYLWSKNRWTKEWAAARAEMLGVALTDEHWIIIDHVRDYSKTHGIAPILLIACKTLNTTKQRVVELFGEKPMRNVAKIAGLERPTGCT